MFMYLLRAYLVLAAIASVMVIFELGDTYQECVDVHAAEDARQEFTDAVAYLCYVLFGALLGPIIVWQFVIDGVRGRSTSP